MFSRGRVTGGRTVYGDHRIKPTKFAHFILVNGGDEEVEVEAESVQEYFGTDHNGEAVYLGDEVSDMSTQKMWKVTAEDDPRYIHEHCTLLPF